MSIKMNAKWCAIFCFAFWISVVGNPVYSSTHPQKQLEKRFDSRVVWNHPGILGAHCPGMQYSCYIHVMKQYHANPEAIRFVRMEVSLNHSKSAPALYPASFKNLGRVGLASGCFMSADLGCVWFLLNGRPMMISISPGKIFDRNPLYKKISSYLRSEKLFAAVESNRASFEKKEKLSTGKQLYIFQFPFMPFDCCPSPYSARLGYLFSKGRRFIGRKMLSPCYNSKFRNIQGKNLRNVFHLSSCQP